MRAVVCPRARALRIIFFSVLFLLALSLFSCSEERESPYEGIEITPSATVKYTYSDEAKSSGEELIYGTLYCYESECGRVKVSAAEAARLRARAADMSRICADGKISEEKYLSLLRTVYDGRERLAELLLGEGDISSVEELYLTAADLSGKDYFGNILYELMLYSYEKERDRARSLYEENGAGYQLVIANNYQKKIDALVGSVGRENVSRVLDLVFLLSELWEGGELEAGGASLSEGEVLMLLTYRSPEELTVGASGWELILSELSGSALIKDEPSFLEKLAFAASKNGDIAELSEKMPRLISLLAKIQSRLDTADAGYLKSGDCEALILSVLSDFDSEDFSELDYLFSISYENLEYSSLATDFYGSGYSEYFKTLTTADIDALRASVGTDALFDTLKGYIAGKCPALAYAIFTQND